MRSTIKGTKYNIYIYRYYIIGGIINMKRCSKCKISKSNSEFYKSKADKSGLCSYCKVCNNAATKKWQKENKELFYSYTKKYKDKKRDFYIEYKKRLKCQDCGERHSACLVFHHRNPEEKVFTIGCSTPGYSIERIMKEIAKCDVLCANCHKKLHYNLRRII